MWEAILNFFRKPEEVTDTEASVETGARSLTRSHFQIQRIREGNYLYAFEADVVYVPTGERIAVIQGDDEVELRGKARTRVDQYIYNRKMRGASLDL